MTGDGLQSPHASGAQPLPKTVEECGTALFFAGIGNGVHFHLPLLDAFGHRHRQSERFETKTVCKIGSESFRAAFELEADEPRNMRRISRRHRKADIYRGYIAVETIEHKTQGPCADAVAGECVDEILHETACHRDDCLLRDDGFEQMAPAMI